MKILKLDLEIEDDGKRYRAIDFRFAKDGEYYLYSDYWTGIDIYAGTCFHNYIIMEEIPKENLCTAQNAKTDTNM